MQQQVSLYGHPVSQVHAGRRTNVDEIASSMQHLDAMQASVEELRARMAQAHGDHQEAGESLIKLLEMLQEATRVQAAVKESRKVVPWH